MLYVSEKVLRYIAQQHRRELFSITLTVVASTEHPEDDPSLVVVQTFLYSDTHCLGIIEQKILSALNSFFLWLEVVLDLSKKIPVDYTVLCFLHFDYTIEGSFLINCQTNTNS